ncbi:hypothetical protein Q31b_39700 [Novipirellula aureliae]|uniref:Uncharacterized protein n=2 Tax=Novipirellula aureliae TaxID=2527966 RepID=A0A5C6DQJ0_9BACT|nr:hypothetical protein Q31b_39700 [Novipirellula aureliae]
MVKRHGFLFGLLAVSITVYADVGEIAFAPRISPRNFRAPFTVAEGWGTFSQSIRDKQMQAKLEPKWGSLVVGQTTLDPGKVDMRKVVVTCDGKPLAAAVDMIENNAVVRLEAPVQLQENQELRLVLVPYEEETSNVKTEQFPSSRNKQ